MRAEVVAVGTELLLGYVTDTNSAWIGEQLALHGIDCLLATKVGDNTDRIAAAVRGALERADAVIICGGLGPTQDDVTREALAQVMGVPLERDAAIAERIAGMFRAHGVEMGASNLRQADVPVGATPIEQRRGTAPGLVCPIGAKVAYAVPGVPAEMREMVARAVLPDLAARAGTPAVLASRTLTTFGLGESAVAEALAGRVAALAAAGTPSMAFLASAVDGVKVRLTAKVSAPGDGAPDPAGVAAALLDAEEAEVRAVLGDAVYAVDDATMASVVGDAVLAAGTTLATAESLTGGLVGARLTEVPGASRWYRGGVVSYASEVKRTLLDVPEGPVVSAAAVGAMAASVARLTGAGLGVAVSGVAGPDEQDGQPVGTVWIGTWWDGEVVTRRTSLPGQRAEIRSLAVLAALDQVRRRLAGLPID